MGLLFLPDPRAGLSNIYGSLAEGGREVAAVCASPEEVPFLSVVMNTVRKLISHYLPKCYLFLDKAPQHYKSHKVR
jgi:hypothetical protein